jgi:hypothetical protein
MTALTLKQANFIINTAAHVARELHLSRLTKISKVIQDYISSFVQSNRQSKK